MAESCSAFSEVISRDMLYVIFSFLTPRELLICCQVCKHWKAASEENRIWKPLLESRAGKSTIQTPQNSLKLIYRDLNKTSHAFTCFGCKKYPLDGPRFECMHCENVNLCCNCEGKHTPFHILKQYLKREDQLEQPIFKWHSSNHHFTCSVCEQEVSESVAYQCARPSCYSFIICEPCTKRTPHCPENHPLTKLVSYPPTKVLNVEDIGTEQMKHFGYYCNGCYQSSLPGIRWKCLVCSDWDYCIKCEPKYLDLRSPDSLHHGGDHSFLKIMVPIPNSHIFD